MDLCRLYENLIRSIFTFLAETRKRLLLRCRHECYLAPVGFHHYILFVPASHASSAGDMMAVRQTPLSCSLLICNHCSMEHPFIQHHHILQRGDYPAFWPIWLHCASFSLDTAGTASLAGAATIHDHSIACVNG